MVEYCMMTDWWGPPLGVAKRLVAAKNNMDDHFTVAWQLSNFELKPIVNSIAKKNVFEAMINAMDTQENGWKYTLYSVSGNMVSEI